METKLRTDDIQDSVVSDSVLVTGTDKKAKWIAINTLIVTDNTPTVLYVTGQSGTTVTYSWLSTDLKKLTAGKFFITLQGVDIYPEEIASFTDYSVTITFLYGGSIATEDKLKIVSN